MYCYYLRVKYINVQNLIFCDGNDEPFFDATK